MVDGTSGSKEDMCGCVLITNVPTVYCALASCYAGAYSRARKTLVFLLGTRVKLLQHRISITDAAMASWSKARLAAKDAQIATLRVEVEFRDALLDEHDFERQLLSPPLSDMSDSDA